MNLLYEFIWVLWVYVRNYYKNQGLLYLNAVSVHYKLISTNFSTIFRAIYSAIYSAILVLFPQLYYF